MATVDAGESTEHVQLRGVLGDDVEHLDSAYHERMADEEPVAAPWQSLRTHHRHAVRDSHWTNVSIPALNSAVCMWSA